MNAFSFSGDCPSGEYELQGVCFQCNEGTYRNKAEGFNCTMCPSGYTTQGKGSTSRSDCSISELLCVLVNVWKDSIHPLRKGAFFYLLVGRDYVVQPITTVQCSSSFVGRLVMTRKWPPLIFRKVKWLSSMQMTILVKEIQCKTQTLDKD